MKVLAWMFKMFKCTGQCVVGQSNEPHVDNGPEGSISTAPQWDVGRRSKKEKINFELGWESIGRHCPEIT